MGTTEAETIEKLRDELAVVIDAAREMEAEAEDATTTTIGVPFAPVQWTLNRQVAIARARRQQLEMVDEMLCDAQREVSES